MRGTYIVCQSRKGNKIDVRVCQATCQKKEKCKAFQSLNEEKVIQIDPPVEAPEEEETEFKESEVVNHLYRPVVGAKELYDKALSLRTTIETGFLNLGTLLNQMFDSRFFYGHDTWKDFVEGDLLFEQLHIKLRTADNLRAISKRYKELGISPEDCARVGYTKLGLLLPLVNKDNVTELMHEASQMTSKALSVKVRKDTGKLDKDEKEPTHEMKFQLSEAQEETVSRAIDLVMQTCNSDSKNYAIEMICVDYLAGVEITGGRKEYVKNLMGRIEAVMNVKVESVIDKASGELLWG